jgi:D-methionine transport system substrate-binding protein
MYPTYARNLELVGNAERLYVEVLSERTESFAISLVTREGLLESEKIELLKKYLSTEKVRNFLIENYAWASTPAM